MKNLQDLEKRVAVIEARNVRVEADKSWEISWTRRISITVLTYIVVCIYLKVIGNERVLINACVPVIGFLLSMVALKQIRRYWKK